MKATLVGVQDVDFKIDNNEIKGIKLHLLYAENGVVGNTVMTKFLDSVAFKALNIPVDELCDNVGTVIDIDFNAKGKIVGVAV